MNHISAFPLLLKTMKSGLQDAANCDSPLEILCEIGQLVKPSFVASAIQLAESGNVKEVKIDSKPTGNSRITARKIRNFEDFTTEVEFDPRKKQNTFYRKCEQKSDSSEPAEYIEIESVKGASTSNILLPNAHYCTCQYFQKTVLGSCKDWICVHILAYHISKTIFKPDTIRSNPEMMSILQRIILKPYL